MRLKRGVKIQLAVFAVIATVAVTVMFFNYMRIPAAFFGVGHYTVTVQLPQAGGLYPEGNVTYRGVKVGRVVDVRLTDTGAEAVLSLKSGIDIPADLDAEVHSVSAVGEQYVALLPRTREASPLKNGDVIPVSRTSIPPNINSLLASANRGLEAIPRDDLKTVVDESYVAIGGLGPDLSRLLKNTITLSRDARENLDSIVTLIDKSKPLLDSQIQSSDSIQAWASNLATVTTQLKDNDSDVEGLLKKGSQSTDEVRLLLDRVKPTLPVLLSNLVSVGEVAVTYRDNIETLLVAVPQAVGNVQGILVANADTKQDYAGAYLSFNLNLNAPPPCTTGFLPVQQQRAPSFQDAPDIPEGNFYCRIPQDSQIAAVRGARNLPCVTRPGKRAPTVKMCESDEEYVPLNDGFNWKGDPNATLSGQDIPQFAPGEGPSAPEVAPPPVAVVEYDPDTGTYMGPDGNMYTQQDLNKHAGEQKSWQQMLMPPAQN
ncbi:MCE family protein [Mycolicibacterium pulveris]|uniref:MCE family protein n=1 Tax=Mycolicibacterium pulveris TaxID=36813 RepID=UPI003CF076C6